MRAASSRSGAAGGSSKRACPGAYVSAKPLRMDQSLRGAKRSFIPIQMWRNSFRHSGACGMSCESDCRRLMRVRIKCALADGSSQNVSSDRRTSPSSLIRAARSALPVLMLGGRAAAIVQTLSASEPFWTSASRAIRPYPCNNFRRKSWHPFMDALRSFDDDLYAVLPRLLLPVETPKQLSTRSPRLVPEEAATNAFVRRPATTNANAAIDEWQPTPKTRRQATCAALPNHGAPTPWP